jgi:hippurate hydrolase
LQEKSGLEYASRRQQIDPITGQEVFVMHACGHDALLYNPTKGMGAEDFPFLTTDPEITSVYWLVGGTPREAFEREAEGGEPVPSHHSPLFKIDPESSVRTGVESTVVALMELLGHPGSD